MLVGVMEFVLRRKILCTIQGNDPGTETGASGRVGARNNRIDGHPRGHQVKIEILAGTLPVASFIAERRVMREFPLT